MLLNRFILARFRNLSQRHREVGLQDLDRQVLKLDLAESLQ